MNSSAGEPAGVWQLRGPPATSVSLYVSWLFRSIRTILVDTLIFQGVLPMDARCCSARKHHETSEGAALLCEFALFDAHRCGALRRRGIGRWASSGPPADDGRRLVRFTWQARIDRIEYRFGVAYRWSTARPSRGGSLHLDTSAAGIVDGRLSYCRPSRHTSPRGSTPWRETL
jgi:hypothetical protein